MKMFFTIFLVLNFLAETLAAVSLIGADSGLAAALDGVPPIVDGNIGATGLWSMHYGFAVIAIASAILWVWPHRSSRRVATAVLGILMTFHVALTCSLVLEGTQAPGMVLHAVLALMAIALFVLRGRWCDQP